jgi:hypothetical protein
MADDLRISLPEPCGERWEDMAPRGCNRHCASCDTLIHDLEAMTVEQAEALLDGGGKVCVRARVARNGRVRTADGGSARRIFAAVGATATLAAAACQTTPPEQRANRFEITGTIPQFSDRKPVVRSSDGRTWHVEMPFRSTSFRVPNLYPGVYSITYAVGCGERREVVDNIVIRDSSVDLGRLEDTYGCIVVGLITRDSSNGGRG